MCKSFQFAVQLDHFSPVDTSYPLSLICQGDDKTQRMGMITLGCKHCHSTKYVFIDN
ncbi:hypothetical protein T265_03613 [Opisthorchis viverrini]|uniref:Uncharacterized protein n=1 Tax=Opisthorchis viverrini TaxID=6198 RepID=A0A075AHF9_OPIVI|nr:hypothetical protein T265_03613 [Opisthorchis viverrini]KER29814.1 hypothetical protein T265_03613 [Opisthorchis viverrini]